MRFLAAGSVKKNICRCLIFLGVKVSSTSICLFCLHDNLGNYIFNGSGMR